MRKFKVGDQVKILAGTGGLANTYINQMGTITQIDYDSNEQEYFVAFNDDSWWYYDYQLKSINSDTIKERLGVK